ncbi:MAG: AI-2E family transporter [Solirubrobacterales bacterium]
MSGSEGTRPPQPGLDRRGVNADRVVVLFHPRSILTALGVLLGVVVAVEFFFLAEAGLTLIAIALFLALALNPAVEFFQGHGLGRGWAVGAVYALTLVVFSLLGIVFIPPLVDQITKFVNALPGLVDDLTKGHGPLGFLERKYQVVERVRSATTGKNAGDLLGEAGSAFSAIKGVATTVVGLIIIAFLTFFMLLEGPEWRQRLMELIPAKNRPAAERIGTGIYKAVGGFVAGNLLASVLAGVVATIIMLATGVPYAVPLGLFVAIIELIPYIGPLVTTVLVTAVALTQGLVTALVVFVLLLVYHLIEGHTLRPLVYGRAVKLSPLAVLIAILLGTEIAGILGALAAIPIAGSIQVVIVELLEQRGGVDTSAAAR